MASELRAGTEFAVPLRRHSRVAVTFNLNWHVADLGSEPTDLDLGCLCRDVDGRVAAVQSLQPVSTGANVRRGSLIASAGPEPGAIGLDGDDRDGNLLHGETITIDSPGQVEFAIVFASIYRGVSDFSRVRARLTISVTGRPPVFMCLANPDPELSWCAVVACGMQGRDFVVVPQERYFLSGFHADRHYGFGFDWVVGHKPPEMVAE